MENLVHDEGAYEAVVILHFMDDFPLFVRLHMYDAVFAVHTHVVGVDRTGDVVPWVAPSEEVLAEVERNDLFFAEYVFYDDHTSVSVVRLLFVVFPLETDAEFLPAVLAFEYDGGTRFDTALLESYELFTFRTSDFLHNLNNQIVKNGLYG